jgi:hypothetical protein
VLEIGAGTGANLPFYGPAVESLTVTEPEPPMLRRLERRVREHARSAAIWVGLGQLTISAARSDSGLSR